MVTVSSPHVRPPIPRAALQPRLEAYAKLARFAGFIERLGGRELEQARVVPRRRA